MTDVTLGLVGYSRTAELVVDGEELVEVTVNGKAVAAIDPRPEAASIGTWEDVEQQENYRRRIHIGKALGVPGGLEGPAASSVRGRRVESLARWLLRYGEVVVEEVEERARRCERVADDWAGVNDPGSRAQREKASQHWRAADELRAELGMPARMS